jgi:ketosteroid isomerase-like protein
MKIAVIFAVLFLLGCQTTGKPDADSVLNDKAAVQESVIRLFIATDNRDWDEVKAVFADDVMFDMTSMGAAKASLTAAADIVRMWEDGLKALQAIHHQVGNFMINVNGDKATVFSYGTATHYLPNPTNNNVRTFVGSYDFELRKLAGDWRISAFKFNLKYMDGNPELENSSQ